MEVCGCCGYEYDDDEESCESRALTWTDLEREWLAHNVEICAESRDDDCVESVRAILKDSDILKLEVESVNADRRVTNISCKIELPRGFAAPLVKLLRENQDTDTRRYVWGKLRDETDNIFMYDKEIVGGR